MNITLENKANSVKVVYNDLQGAGIFSKRRTIMKAAIKDLKLSSDESYVEINYIDGTAERVSFELFEGIASNASLYDLLDSML